MREIKLLTWLQLSNFLGINKLRHSKDRKKRLGLLGIFGAYLVLGVGMVLYVGALTYALILMGMGNLIPQYLGLVVSLLCLLFSIAQVGQQVFDLKSYDKTIVLPVRQQSIVISRFLTLYVSNAGLSLLMIAAGTAVCAWAGYGWLFCGAMLLGGLLLPLLPMTLGLMAGGLIHAVASRMRHRSLTVTVLSMALLVGVLILSMGATSMTEADETQLLSLMAGMLRRSGDVYRPLGWFAEGTFGSLGAYGLFTLASLGAFFLVSWVLGRNFRKICSALSGQRAGSSFVLAVQNRGSVGKALYRSELRRYFSCSIYVSNTLVGYIMAVVLAAAALTGALNALPEVWIPYFLGILLGMSPTTVNALSMEGKQWWLAQHLPVTAKQIFSAKIAVHLTLALPCTAISQVLLLIFCWGNWEAVLLTVLLPPVYALFFGVAGMAVNIRMPMLDWENAAQPVKQSKATLVAMLLSMAAGGAPLVLTILFQGYGLVIGLAADALLLFLTAAIYRWIGSVDLREIAG